MIRKILDKIEKNRGSNNFFKKRLVLIKDFIWEIYSYINFYINFNPSIKWNKKWNYYSWKKDGDEWIDQALFCKQTYEKWKKSILENFIKPNINKESFILEIAPGHGRWTEFLLDSKKLFLVDLNKDCIEFCKKKFSKHKNIEYYTNDGMNLSFIKSNSVDFIFSYDSFVHMEKKVINSYFHEFSRIFKKKGKAIVHHSGGRKILFYKANKRMAKGSRSKVSKRDIRKLAKRNNLIVKSQINSWGENKKYNCKCCGDYISYLIKK